MAQSDGATKERKGGAIDAVGDVVEFVTPPEKAGLVAKVTGLYFDNGAACAKVSYTDKRCMAQRWAGPLTALKLVKKAAERPAAAGTPRDEATEEEATEEKGDGNGRATGR